MVTSPLAANRHDAPPKICSKSPLVRGTFLLQDAKHLDVRKHLERGPRGQGYRAAYIQEDELIRAGAGQAHTFRSRGGAIDIQSFLVEISDVDVRKRFGVAGSAPVLPCLNVRSGRPA